METFSRFEASDFKSLPAIPEARRNELEQLISHLSVIPISATYYKCTSRWHIGPRRVQKSYWTLVRRGKGTVFLEDMKFKVSPGAVIIFPAGMEHSFFPEINRSIDMINVHFHARIYGTIDILSLLGIKGVFTDGDGLYSELSYELAKAFALKPPAYKWYMKNIINSFIHRVIFLSAGRRSKSGTDFKKLSRLYPALEMINENISNPEFSLQDMTEKLNISAVYMRKLFSSLFRQSPLKFIHSRRMESACEMLKATDFPVKQIAEKTGFNDLQFFYRIFSRTIGTTPAKYRETLSF